MPVTCTNTILGSYEMSDEYSGFKKVWGKGDVTTCSTSTK